MKNVLSLLCLCLILALNYSCSGAKENPAPGADLASEKKEKTISEAEFRTMGQVEQDKNELEKAAFYFHRGKDFARLKDITRSYEASLHQTVLFNGGLWKSAFSAKPGFIEREIQSERLILLKPRLLEQDSLDIPFLSKSGTLVPIVFDWILTEDPSLRLNALLEGTWAEHAKYEQMVVNSRTVPFTRDNPNLIKMNLGIKSTAFGRTTKFFTYSFVDWQPHEEYQPIVFYWNPNDSHINEKTVPGSSMEVDFFVTGNQGPKDIYLSNFVTVRFKLLEGPKD